MISPQEERVLAQSNEEAIAVLRDVVEAQGDELDDPEPIEEDQYWRRVQELTGATSEGRIGTTHSISRHLFDTSGRARST